MSKGPGSVQRKIDSLFAGDPEGVFSTADLCDEVYGLTIEFSKKQHVSIIRAAHAVAKNHPSIHALKCRTRGSSWIWLHRDNLMSFAIAHARPSPDPEAQKPTPKPGAPSRPTLTAHSSPQAAPGGQPSIPPPPRSPSATLTANTWPN
jgi:hypothetical protein